MGTGISQPALSCLRTRRLVFRFKRWRGVHLYARGIAGPNTEWRLAPPSDRRIDAPAEMAARDSNDLSAIFFAGPR
jgi:hypothetical protein